MRRWLIIAFGIAAAIIVPQIFVDSPLFARVVSVAAVCLILWLAEAAPPFVPTLLLFALIPLFISPLEPSIRLPVVLGWAADPVLALFFGGFALGVAAERYGIDRQLIGLAFRVSGNSYNLLLLLVIFLTAFLSMWLSNIAAAALMFACLRSSLQDMDADNILRRMLLVGVALGADLGGIATPIGTGPNAVAIASIADTNPVSFIGWMIFAFPLTIGMLLISYFLLVWRTHGTRSDWRYSYRPEALDERPDPSCELTKKRLFILIMGGTVVLWLSEPLHGIAAAIVSLIASTALFLTGVLDRESLRRIDWSTLLLISGGITLGRLLEATAIVQAFTESFPIDSFDPRLGLFLLCLFTAVLAALMSNTASVIMVIPLATALIPSPSTAIIVAIAASFGIPFIISTPPNAMAHGEGGVSFGDLFWPGIILMIIGCLIISFTGPTVLRIAGIY